MDFEYELLFFADTRDIKTLLAIKKVGQGLDKKCMPEFASG